MSHLDDELARWSEDFRATDAASVTVPSADEIVAQATRDARKRKLEWVVQVVGTAFAVIVFGLIVAKTKAMLMAVLAAVVLPVLLALFAVFAHQRLSAARERASSVSEHVTEAVRHRIATHRIARASMAAMVVLTIAFWSWLPFWILAHREKFSAEPWRIVVSLSVGVLVFAGGLVRCAQLLRKSRDEVVRWRAIDASMNQT